MTCLFVYFLYILLQHFLTLCLLRRVNWFLAQRYLLLQHTGLRWVTHVVLLVCGRRRNFLHLDSHCLGLNSVLGLRLSVHVWLLLLIHRLLNGLAILVYLLRHLSVLRLTTVLHWVVVLLHLGLVPVAYRWSTILNGLTILINLRCKLHSLRVSALLVESRRLIWISVSHWNLRLNSWDYLCFVIYIHLFLSHLFEFII